MGRALRVIGYVLLCVGFTLILIGSIGVLLSDGIRAFLWLFNPFNYASFIVNLLTLAPGLLLIHFSRRIEARNSQSLSE